MTGFDAWWKSFWPKHNLLEKGDTARLKAVAREAYWAGRNDCEDHQ